MTGSPDLKAEARDERPHRAEPESAIAQLAGGLAHEFNNLLTVITGYTCVLLGTHGPGDSDHEALSQIQHAAERFAVLVRQLLAISGRQMLTLVPVDLNALLLHRTEVFKRVLGPAIQLHLNLDPSLPRVKLDAEQIEQVLLELAAHARAAMPVGGQFTLTTTLRPEAIARLTVADTGPGLDEQTLAHLFEPFSRLRSASREAGLGLAAAQGTIRQCGGELLASSRPGEGTTFTLTFPALVPPAAPPTPPPGTRTILLVDDDTAVRALAGHVLRSQGYQVLEASEGVEALEVYARHAGAIDLLVSDVVMPGMGGPELARRLAAQAPQLPVLFLSGCNKDDVDLSEPVGAQRPRFLAKPFLPLELIQIVRDAIGEKPAE